MRNGPLFVVGMWRSGTSLFYALFNQHPQIGLMYESDMLTLGAAVLHSSKKLLVAEQSGFLERCADAAQD